MMSAPDNIDVNIPTVSSAGNLRQMMAAATMSASDEAQQPADMNNNTNNNNNRRGGGTPSSSSPTPPPSSIPMEIINGHPPHHLQQQSNQNKNNQADYSAWMVGSTEYLAKAVAAFTATTGGENSCWRLPPWQINIHGNNQGAASSSSSPAPTESTTPSLSGTPPPPPTPSPTPSTLGGLSQQHHMTHAAQMHPPLPHPPPAAIRSSFTTTTTTETSLLQQQYHSTLLTTPTPIVESLLSTTCETLNFDIAEMWLRTGPKTHQLTHSHVRATALDESVRQQLVDVYYGERSNERTHRLSPALCKRAKEAGEVVWVTAQTRHGAEALKCSISDVRTAVAVPVCHTGAAVNVTIIYFSIRRAIMKPTAVEFLIHMSLAVAVASVNAIAEDVMVVDSEQPPLTIGGHNHHHGGSSSTGSSGNASGLSAAAAVAATAAAARSKLSKSCSPSPQQHPMMHLPNRSLAFQGSDPRATPQRLISVTGAQLNLQWESLRNVEYLTDGGNNWIHTAVLQGKSVVVKTLKPECQDVALAINEIEGELEIHSRLDHPNIVKLIGAGFTPRGVRFVVLERLDGGTLTQLLGYDTRIRDRRRRFWAKKKISYMDVLKCARSLAEALAYCHGRAIPNAMVLHRDLKPDNVGFTLDGTVKLIDFGLARTVENATISNDVYEMSGETGSLRYMAPEVADCQPYNQKADVYSFGIILWELVANKKPYDGMNRDEFYSRVVHGGERPVINNKKWPVDLIELMKNCWDTDIAKRPDFADIVDALDGMLSGEKDGHGNNNKKKKPRKSLVAALIDRHSTWF
uniref:Protein kinase domain-containing protein n=1 Tax=Skeletonema marinoi TaxID=267567 RepID=A0A7S2LY51_9STRA|mmetsp:Transcript_30622/g.52031  ORF Transcript_30622/g.52031 Transcript_30622/m.52031 type:complete len:801 (+) Transcript_30622:166-2568(+)